MKAKGLSPEGNHQAVLPEPPATTAKPASANGPAPADQGPENELPSRTGQSTDRADLDHLGPGCQTPDAQEKPANASAEAAPGPKSMRSRLRRQRRREHNKAAPNPPDAKATQRGEERNEEDPSHRNSPRDEVTNQLAVEGDVPSPESEDAVSGPESTPS